MTIRPILMSGPMVRAILDGRKSQTRRVLSIRGHKTFKVFGRSDTPGYDWQFRDAEMRWHDLRDNELKARLRFAVGDLLWVKETWADVNLYGAPGIAYRADEHIRDLMDEPDFHCEDGTFNYVHERLQFGARGLDWSVWASDLISGAEGNWRSPLHMPRWVSRLTLRVTDIRVQRLQAISEADAVAEGCGPYDKSLNPNAIGPARAIFEALWDSLNAKRGHGWDTDPWVVAVSFEAFRANVDAVTP
ncbi:hypothetical protein FKB34_01995 [Glycocaulis profundi]|nr:hypothetical protein FKB34_01995 [Glycocaulis profundi]